jgi:hypothetical protein
MDPRPAPPRRERRCHARTALVVNLIPLRPTRREGERIRHWLSKEFAVAAADLALSASRASVSNTEMSSEAHRAQRPGDAVSESDPGAAEPAGGVCGPGQEELE